MPSSSPEYMREWYESNPDYHREWRANNPESVKAANKAYREKNREVLNAKKKLKRYGVSEEQFLEMMDRQGGVCAICGEEETRVIKGTVASLCIDHDHDTGAVRALLCHRCNRTIGQFNDSPDLVRRAAEYLEYHGNIKEAAKSRRKQIQ